MNVIPSEFTQRLNEIRIPTRLELADFPNMVQPLVDRLKEFLNGWPMLVTTIPTGDGREVLRVETREPHNEKNRSVCYVWPRTNQ